MEQLVFRVMEGSLKHLFETDLCVFFPGEITQLIHLDYLSIMRHDEQELNILKNQLAMNQSQNKLGKGISLEGIRLIQFHLYIKYWKNENIFQRSCMRGNLLPTDRSASSVNSLSTSAHRIEVGLCLQLITKVLCTFMCVVSTCMCAAL